MLQKSSTGEKRGFVCVSGLSDGHALIANHTCAGGGTIRAQVFADIFPGLGLFATIRPRHRRALTRTNLAKNSCNFKYYQYKQVCLGYFYTGRFNLVQCWNLIDKPGTYLGYTFYGGTSAENYSVARSQGGRIGIAYTNNNTLNPGSEDAVWFMESADNGSTFSTPLKIFAADYSASGDSLGAMRSVTLVYQYDNPKIAFSIIKQDPTAASYFPLFPNKCMFWSTTLPGTDPDRSIVVADENNVWYPQDSLYQGVNDVYAPFDRPSLGLSADGNALFYSIMVQTNRFGGAIDTTNLRAQYLDSFWRWRSHMESSRKNNSRNTSDGLDLCEYCTVE